MDYTPEAVANYHCELGEGPVWHPDLQKLYWTNISAGKLYSYEPSTGQHGIVYEGEPVGGYTFQEDGSLLLFRVNDIARFVEGGSAEVLTRVEDEDMARFNDVIADPRGRVFAGTIGKEIGLGGLYRIDLDGAVTCLFKGTKTANGMAFTEDLKTFYWTDSTAKTIYRFDYDIDTGELSGRREVVAFDPNEGTPDGLTIDTDGCLWSARWGGYGVYRISPEGEVLEKISLPVPKTSCPAFGGADLRDLYVTTAGGSPEEKSVEGTLYRIRTPYQGRREFRSRVLI
jgi:D-xylonolactonase